MKSTITLIVLVLIGNLGFSQPIPTDSMYVGQTPPGNTPVIFNLPTSNGLHACERIAISSDEKEIYYGEIDTYPPVIKRIKCLRYFEDHWQGPQIVFSDQTAPALSPNDSLLFLQSTINDIIYSYASLKTDTGWSTPKLLFALDQNEHYFQQTSFDNYYLSSLVTNGNDGNIGYIDFTGNDTVVVNLQMPVNSLASEGDFFVARDESFLIVSRAKDLASDMYLSFKRSDGGWTNPKPFGSSINTSDWEYGMFTSPDNKYLFFTRGGNISMSSYYTYWVRIDNIMDSLKKTNFIPYIKKPIPDQTDSTGHHITFTIPDTTFFDDDGNETLTITAKMNNNKSFPDWLTYNEETHTFEGTPTGSAYINIKVTATDTAGASVSDVFAFNIEGNPVGISQLSKTNFRIYPNPANNFLNIESPYHTEVICKIYDVNGQLVICRPVDISNSRLEISCLQAGDYLLQLIDQNETVYTIKFLKQ